MSAEAAGWVYRHSPFEGATFAVHCALADAANDVHEYEVWTANETLATKARVSTSTAKVALGKLVKAGFLEVLVRSKGGRGQTSRYRFLMPRDAPVVFEQSWRARVEAERDAGDKPAGDRPVSEQTGRSEDGIPADLSDKPAGDRPQTQEEPKERTQTAAPIEEQGALVDVPKAKKERARNPIFDALAACYPNSTKSEGTLIGMVAAELGRLDPKPAPEEIIRRARAALREWPGSTPRALATHWTALGDKVRGPTSSATAKFDDLDDDYERRKRGSGRP